MEFKRRSSILKPNRNLENGAGNGEPNGSTSPISSRRVSFAENMKVKTFDETGCNTSELVPHPAARDMSLVDTTMNCENMSVEMEISQEEKSAIENKQAVHKTITNIHITASSQKVAATHKVQASNGAKAKATANSGNESDSEEDNDTGDILSQMKPKVITKSKPGNESPSDDMTADILRKMSTSVGLRQLRGLNDTTSIMGAAEDSTAISAMKSGIDASELHDDTIIAPVSNETRKELEKWQQRRQEAAKRTERLKQLMSDFQQDAVAFRDQLKKRPLAKYSKKEGL